MAAFLAAQLARLQTSEAAQLARTRAVEGRHWRYEEELLAIFAMIDEDENGAMDFSQLLDLGKGVSASFTAEKCRAVLGWLDGDHDGTITKEEFVKFFEKIMRNYSQEANDRGIVQVTNVTADSIYDDMSCHMHDDI